MDQDPQWSSILFAEQGNEEDKIIIFTTADNLKDGIIIEENSKKSHINLFEIVEAVKQEQAYAEVSITQLATGAQPPRRAWKEVQKDNKIHKLKEQFMENRISLGNYLRGISLLTTTQNELFDNADHFFFLHSFSYLILFSYIPFSYLIYFPT